MKKFNKLFLTLLIGLLGCAPSFASVGVQVNSVNSGTATDLNFITPDSVDNDGSTYNVNVVGADMIAAGAANGGGTSMTSTETAVPTSYAIVRKAISNTVGLAGTLANGVKGQILNIRITSVVGSGTFVLTPTTKYGFTSVTFDAAGDAVTLLFVDTTTGWIIIGQNSITVS